VADAEGTGGHGTARASGGAARGADAEGCEMIHIKLNDTDGGQAFPHGNETHGGEQGMTLRDYFAANIAVGLVALSRYQTHTGIPINNYVANDAYAIADAMLKARAAK